ncbi:MAG: hypothetical protein ACLFVI_07870 [Archaeoglobaceae archaeon]
MSESESDGTAAGSKNRYFINSQFTVEGTVESSDVIGAIFGQTEELLGEELDLRDLQEKGKIGRIEVELENEGGRSHGEINIPTNLDKVETATLAAALETIEKIGPSSARVRLIEITRTEFIENKRKEIVERAKELVKTSFKEHKEESEEITELRNMIN